ncbi:MAG: thiol:disulfide interchange protein DsbA [Morganella sp. (in: enterobacteria)]
MKKFWLAMMGFAMTFSVFASPVAGKQYTELKTPVANQPEVVEFFSFYCPHCYQFEENFKVPEAINKNLPEGTKHERYHVDFLGGDMGPELTKAWSVAMAMGVEDKVTPILFKGIQETGTIKNANDVREAFIQAGITGDDYDAAANSIFVKSLIAKQQKAAADYKLRGVPAVFVKGKYQINNGGLEVKDVAQYGKAFSDTVNYLLKQK